MVGFKASPLIMTHITSYESPKIPSITFRLKHGWIAALETAFYKPNPSYSHSPIAVWSQSCADTRETGASPPGWKTLKRCEGRKQWGPPWPDRHDVWLSTEWPDAMLPTSKCSTSLPPLETRLHEPSELTSGSSSSFTWAAICEASAESRDHRCVIPSSWSWIV